MQREWGARGRVLHLAVEGVGSRRRKMSGNAGDRWGSGLGVGGGERSDSEQRGEGLLCLWRLTLVLHTWLCAGAKTSPTACSSANLTRHRPHAADRKQEPLLLANSP